MRHFNSLLSWLADPAYRRFTSPSNRPHFFSKFFSSLFFSSTSLVSLSLLCFCGCRCNVVVSVVLWLSVLWCYYSIRINYCCFSWSCCWFYIFFVLIDCSSSRPYHARKVAAGTHNLRAPTFESGLQQPPSTCLFQSAKSRSMFSTRVPLEHCCGGG